jgi:pyruvate/2-oxoglutarate/acetoin dehydrogenase E1 component
VELIDLRWVKPLDEATILTSVAKTGALLVVDSGLGQVGAEVVRSVATAGGQVPLSNPPPCLMLSSLHATIPAARDLHDQLMPSQDDVRRAVDRLAEASRAGR